MNYIDLKGGFFLSTLGERIKRSREAKGLLQNDLAKLIGVKSSGVISNWENDLNKPDAEKIVKLCNVLDISASFLLDYYGKSSFEFSSLEEEHIKKYRSLDDLGKETVDYILNREVNRIKELQKKNDLISKLEANFTIKGYDKLEIKAARNDYESDPEEQKKMREDLSNLKRPN